MRIVILLLDLFILTFRFCDTIYNNDVKMSDCCIVQTRYSIQNEGTFIKIVMASLLVHYIINE